MARKKTRTATSSHLPDESESPHPHLHQSPTHSPNPNPSSVGAEQTPSADPVILISGESEKKKKKKKDKSRCYKVEPSAPSAAEEWRVSSPNPKHLETECRGSEGLQSGALPVDTEMSTGEVERSMGKGVSKMVMDKEQVEGNRSPQKASGAHLCHWCLNRRPFWHHFLHQSRKRRPRRIRASPRRKRNKVTETADNHCPENQSQSSGIKLRNTDNTMDVGDSSVSVQSESLTEPENDSSVQSESMTEPENDSSVQSESMTEPAKNSSVLTDPMSDPEDDDSEDYCKTADIQSLWRPPKPKEDGIWVPSPVKTNGQGRRRILSGDQFVEIFDIEVDLSGRTKTYGNIHGNVALQCEGYRTFIFDYNKESAPAIQQKGSLPLKGLDVAPLAYDSVGIFINLKIDDEELCEDALVWDPSYSSTDKWLYDSLEGRNGFVNVTLAVMKQACLAELDVKLINSTNEASSKIYGNIVVYINNMRYLRYSAFSMGRDACSIVKPQESIPLSRSLFSCRCGSSLVVKVDLWDSDTNKPLACGALLFSPEYYGDSKGTVPCSMVEVKVNWVNHMDHLKTFQALRLDRYFKFKGT